MKTFFRKMMVTDSRWSVLPLRIVLGLVMTGHGLQKLLGWYGGHGLKGTAQFFSTQLGMEPGIFWAFLAGAGEFLGGALVFIGLTTRLGAFLIGITMLVAIIKVHPNAFFMHNGGMEYPLTLFAISLTLMMSGGGCMSADQSLIKKS